MTFATVMVSLALNQPNETRLEVAGQLAEQFGATMIGIAAAQFAPPVYFTTGEQAQLLIDEETSALAERLDELETQFREACKHRSKSLEWRSAVDFPTRFVLQAARAADIIVDGGRSPAFSDAFALASPKDLVMQTGRPLLVVPDRVDWLDLRSVLVAWKDTPEARRAVADALPLLRKARQVTVAEIAEAGKLGAAATSSVQDVVAWLSRHGISAHERVSAGDSGDVAARLDDIAGEAGASLIVAGAYGHSRFRELILGGVTQHLINQSARCVLLSH
ncbi:MAG: universal stress protein [Bradyrhizobium sp.]|uniref:universal stress protein n=1 Tax=Bradyrhizobium sp. TaxID=376 RepID=UPI001D9A2D0C|nr:universal stress protein [Bradyrhizobium sp.]MBV9563600.1 universal stress protein [Bradyrhizobium sp.]